MANRATETQRLERKPPTRARRVGKRLMARDLMPGAHREICEQFAIRGADSDAALAETWETQRPSVVSVVLYDLARRVRTLESRQMIQRLSGLQLVGRERAA